MKHHQKLKWLKWLLNNDRKPRVNLQIGALCQVVQDLLQCGGRGESHVQWYLAACRTVVLNGAGIKTHLLQPPGHRIYAELARRNLKQTFRSASNV